MTAIEISKRNLTLGTLVRSAEVNQPLGDDADRVIKRIALTSQDVCEGDLFICLTALQKGVTGLEYMQQAIDAGAAFIIKDASMATPASCGQTKVIEAHDVRQLKALIASRIYKGMPSKIVPPLQVRMVKQVWWNFQGSSLICWGTGQRQLVHLVY